MTMDGPTHLLANWAATLPRSRTAAVEREAIEGFKDILACMVGGSAEATARNIAELARSMGEGNCTLVGNPTKQKVSASAAAFANGLAAHILDFDDSFKPLQGHISTTVIPAVLAIAEDRNLPGTDLLDAFTVGVEAAATIGRANPDVFNRGWHNTSVIGTLATTVACCRILRLDTEQTRSAIGIAVSSTAGNMSQNGFEVKPLQPAFAARDGVMAAYLAEMGIKSNPETLSGSLGFSTLYSLKGENVGNTKNRGADNQAAQRYTVPQENDPLSMAEPGLIYKPWACCGDMHRSIEGVLDIITKHNIKPQDVQSVETALPYNSARNLPYIRPTSTAEARFCLPYNLALAFIYRRITLSDFDEDKLNRQELLDFMPKVSMSILEGSLNSDRTHLDYMIDTRVIMNSGAVYSDSRIIRKGDKRNSLTEEDWKDKMEDCYSQAFSPKRTDAVLKLVDRISELPHLGELMGLLRGPI
jgi:2-methylcitrate dehydratase PrpD